MGRGAGRALATDRSEEFSVSGARWVFVFPFLRKLLSVMNTNKDFCVVIAFRLAQRRPSLRCTASAPVSRSTNISAWFGADNLGSILNVDLKASTSWNLCSTALRRWCGWVNVGSNNVPCYSQNVYNFKALSFRTNRFVRVIWKMKDAWPFMMAAIHFLFDHARLSQSSGNRKGPENSIRSFSFASQAILVRVMFLMYIE